MLPGWYDKRSGNLETLGMTMPPENSRRRADLDDDGLDIRKKNAGRTNAVLVWMAVAAVGIVLLTCVAGGVIFYFMSADSNTTAAKLPGTWRGQFAVGGQLIDARYIFENGGGFRQETLNERGQVVGISQGRWRVFLGEIEIDWDNGSFERATAIWTNDQTMEYEIVDHNDDIQIGIITTLRRQ